MKRKLLLLAGTVSILLALTSGAADAKTAHLHPNFHGSLTGKTIYFSIAGMEPDFDLVNRVIITTLIHSKGLPPARLILDAYLERFQSDTQPVLPDLLHPKKKLQITLGGFFSGEAIIVGRGNKTLYTGSMLAEALIDPRCLLLPSTTKHAPKYCLTEMQHMYVYLQGQGPARGSYIDSRSWFVGNQKLKVTAGRLYGVAKFTKRARKALKKGTGSLTLHQILKDFHLQFPAQRGTGGGGSKQTQCYVGHCINASKAPPTTSKGNGNGPPIASTTSGGVRWTMVLGFCLIGLAVVLLALYFWQGYREKQKLRSSGAS